MFSKKSKEESIQPTLQNEQLLEVKPINNKVRMNEMVGNSIVLLQNGCNIPKLELVNYRYDSGVMIKIPVGYIGLIVPPEILSRQNAMDSTPMIIGNGEFQHVHVVHRNFNKHGNIKVIGQGKEIGTLVLVKLV